MIKLKPCPFCGGEAIVEMDESWYWEWHTYCPQCFTDRGHFNSKYEAIDAWNTRRDDQNVD